jgi:hypothetical protein
MENAFRKIFILQKKCYFEKGSERQKSERRKFEKIRTSKVFFKIDQNVKNEEVDQKVKNQNVEKNVESQK